VGLEPTTSEKEAVMRRFLLALTGVIVVLVATRPGWAAKVEADPDKEYVITPEAGVWMVCVGCYTGDDARNLAHQLVYQLRSSKDHLLPAYIFDYSAELKRKREEDKKAWRERYPDTPVRTFKMEDQFGVLVGGYKDSEAAHEALLKIKKMPAPKLELPGKPAYEIVYQYNPETKKTEAGWVNPLTRSFVTRNPTLPPEKHGTPDFDPLWKKLNADETYSLLENKHPYTLVVKQFEGMTLLKKPEESGKDWKDLFGLTSGRESQLNAAALNAHNLAEALRKMKLEAYVFHTRRSSLVTIGGYDSADDPQLVKMQELIAHQKLAIGKPEDGKSVDMRQLQFMEMPMVMKVPREEKK
jgi:hypothetical protein